MFLRVCSLKGCALREFVRAVSRQACLHFVDSSSVARGRVVILEPQAKAWGYSLICDTPWPESWVDERRINNARL